MARFFTIAAALGLAALLAACGSSKSSQGARSSTGVAGTTAATNAAAEKAQIKQTWTAFFAGPTPAGEKVKLLQNGQKFAPLIQAEAKSPIAKQTKATILRVTLQGPAKATVVYSISIAGKPVLRHQIGVAVRVNGVWQVGATSFCRLLALQGTSPPACKSG